MKKYLYQVCFLLIGLLPKSMVVAQNHVAYPIIDGTFIQESLVADWSNKRWQEELCALKEAGMHYLIFAPTLYTNESSVTEAIFPTHLHGVKHPYKTDLVDNCLRNAAKAGFKVFLGLNFNEKWWNMATDFKWLQGQMEEGNKLADELTKRYKHKYGEAMYGWYWVWEVDNIHYLTENIQNKFAEILNVNLDYLHRITPSMPVMLCPFMNYRLGSAEQYGQMWKQVFSQAHFNKGDIFAPQDCIGAGGLKLDILGHWFSELKKAVDTKPGLLLWSDSETFDQRFWTTAPLDRFVNQLKIEQPYVSNIISFAYSHYYSPYKVNKKYHEVYLHYVRTGVLPISSLKGAVSKLRIQISPNQNPLLTWEAPLDSNEVAGYYVFRNDTLIANIQQGSKRIPFTTAYYGKASLPKGIYRYSVCAYSFTGDTTKKQFVEYKNQDNKKASKLDTDRIPTSDYSFYSDKSLARDWRRLRLSVNRWTVDTREEMEIPLNEGLELNTSNNEL